MLIVDLKRVEVVGFSAPDYKSDDRVAVSGECPLRNLNFAKSLYNLF